MSSTVAQNSLTSFLPTSSMAQSTQASPPPPRLTSQGSGSTPTTSPLKTALADKQDLKSLGEKLQQIATQLGADATPQAVANALNTTPMNLHPGSSHPREASDRVTVAGFIQHLGLPAPTNHLSLTGLAKAVAGRALEHPLGSLGGALSWPVPLSADAQGRLRTIAMSHAHHLADQPLVMQTKGGILEFLRLGTPLSTQTLEDPATLLDALLSSAQAQLMGKALQEKMHGIATPGSNNDYLLAAMALQLDPESITAPRRNTVAGFDLAGTQNLGMSASVVLERLVQHLISQGKTSPAMAPAAAHLLLAARAPVFLIKDIPSSVTYGSPAWLNLAVAAATIEAQTPGKVANMTFTQVMLEAKSAALADPVATESAQKAAVLDWGVANGVLASKDDDLYDSADFTALTQAFNARNTLMASATTALDTELPSRRDMALAELKKRFPGQEALFEEKVISVTTGHDIHTEGGKGSGYGKLLTGLHSMLDIAMMDLKHPDLVFHTADSRIPIAQMNADAHFDISDEFDQQFAKGIEDKKTAVGTVIKHLIAQLPLEDRKNFEYGDVSFFQNTSYQLGTGFTDRTQLPPGQELLVSITRNGVTKAYEINFNKGVIAPVANWHTTVKESRSGRVVHQTNAFEASYSAALKERAPEPSAGTVPDSFLSSRTQVIADTLVKHLDLDNPQIKAQARGLTTEDRRQGLADGLGDFLLNLIPFRSAVVNFKQGNYGDGAFDLALDVFGFLTAGVGTIGKALRIGTSAVSAATKAFKVAKVIGAATLSSINPLSGLGDLAVGTARLTGSGLKYLGSKAVQGINTLRGASGNYDLLKAASKQHGPTLIGTYNVGGLPIEGPAVLKNQQWYAYNHVTNQPYGLPISDFTPRGAPWVQAPAGEANQGGYFVKLNANLAQAKAPNNLPAYNRGYNTGRISGLPDYRPGMNSAQLRQLAEQPGRRPDEMGVLARELRASRIEDAKYTSALLKQDVDAPGVHISPVSQIHFTAQTDLASKGECAGLSNALALAIHRGQEHVFLSNLNKATNNPGAPGSGKFIEGVRGLQDQVGTLDTFHMGAPESRVGYQAIIDKLTNFSDSRTLRLGTKDHAMLAGIKVEKGVDDKSTKVEWFFYEPNSGYVTFTTLESMQKGMAKVLGDGQIAATQRPFKSASGENQYNVSRFEESDLSSTRINRSAVEDLFSKAL